MLQIRPPDPNLGNQLELHPGGCVGSQRGQRLRSRQERGTASGQLMVNQHCVTTPVKFRNILPLVTICEIRSLALRSRVVVFLCCQMLPGATQSLRLHDVLAHPDST